MAKVPLAKRVRELREARGWSQERLEEKTGFKKGYVSLIESGKRNPKIDKLEILAKVFGLTVAELTPDEAQVIAEERAGYSIGRYETQLWRRFAAVFKAGDPVEFIETMERLPASDQAIVSRIARLMALGAQIGQEEARDGR